MGNFIETYGAHVLASIGIIQFWIKVLWDQYFRKGKIDYYETGTIVIGYGTSGPTIGLNGTIRALNKDVFIRAIDLLVIREKDKAQHNFKWNTFQSPQIYTVGSQSTPMELPSGFLISPNSPHRFNIVFNDNDLFRDISPLLNSYLSEWYKTIKELTQIWSPSIGVQPPAEISSRQHNLIEDFRKSTIHFETYNALNRKYYWEPGDYHLSVNVMSSKPDGVSRKTYGFSISTGDSERLRLNVIAMLQQPIAEYLRVNNFPYNWAFSEYITERESV